MRKRYNTLTFHMWLCMALLLASVGIFTLQSIKHINSEQEASHYVAALSEPSSKLYAGLDEVKETAYNIGRAQSAFDDEAYRAKSAALVENADSLRSILREEAYSREATDLYYMLDSYRKLCDGIATDYLSRDYAKANRGIEDARAMEYLIRTKLADVSAVVSSRNNARMRQADVQRAEFYRVTLVLAGVVFCSCVFVVAFVSRKVVYPIRSIANAVESFRLSDDAPTVKDEKTLGGKHSLREIDALGTAVYEMQQNALTQHRTRMNNELLRSQLAEEKLRILQVEKQLQEARLKALQAQINPHFLFNTLNMISQMSYIEGAAHTTDLLETFSDFFRYNVEKFDKAVTLEDEINNVEGYIKLQRERFGTRISYEVGIDPTLADARVPCLTIQPLVENAISHGLCTKTEGGKVEVSVKAKGEGFAITVADNGRGMDDDGVKKLVGHVRGLDAGGDSGEHNSIGMANVYQRMRLIYGERLTFEIKSGKGEGMTVELAVSGAKEGEA